MSKKDFYYLSADGKTKIHGAIWLPEQEPKAVLHVGHGMTEYVDSYDEIAKFLNGKGFVVAGIDNLGHGYSVYDETCYGYFGKYEYMIKDLHAVRKKVQAKFPELPYFYWGNSMSSFLGRRYIQLYSEGMAGAIFTGAGSIPQSIMSILICRAISLAHGGKYYSKFIDTVDMDHYCDRIPDAKTYYDWLSRSEDHVEKYINDPLCNIKIKINGYLELGRCIHALQKPENIRKIPKDFPVIFMSGSEDPVGKYGQHPREITESMKKEGMTDVTCKIYEGLRHQLFWEPEADMFFDDLLNWIECRM